jgi:hypothetical protein
MVVIAKVIQTRSGWFWSGIVPSVSELQSEIKDIERLSKYQYPKSSVQVVTIFLN